MGQLLLSAPNVKGWPNNTGWLDTNTIIFRQNWLNYIKRNIKRGKNKGLIVPNGVHKQFEKKLWHLFFGKRETNISKMSGNRFSKRELANLFDNPIFQLK